MNPKSVYMDTRLVPHEFGTRVRGVAFMRQGELAPHERPPLGIRRHQSSMPTPVSWRPISLWNDGSPRQILFDGLVSSPGPGVHGFSLVDQPTDPLEVKPNPLVLESLRGIFDVRCLFEDGAGGEHSKPFVLTNKDPLPSMGTPTWNYFRLRAALTDAFYCDLIAEWPVDQAFMVITALLLRSGREVYDEDLAIRRWSIETRGITSWALNQREWGIPASYMTSAGYQRWDLIPPGARAWAENDSAHAREMVFLFDGPGLPETRDRRNHLLAAMAYAVGRPLLTPMLDEVRDSDGLGVLGGPGPRLRGLLSADEQCRRDHDGYLARDHFGPNGKGEWPWGTPSYSGTTGTPFNDPSWNASFWAVPSAHHLQRMRMQFGFEAARRPHWRPPNLQPGEPRPTLPAGARAFRHTEEEARRRLNAVDVEHPFFPSGSVTLAMLGEPLHMLNVWNRARYVRERYVSGWYEHRVMPTRAEAWHMHMACQAVVAMGEQGDELPSILRSAVILRAQKLLSWIHRDGVTLGFAGPTYDYRNEWHGNDVIIESSWQLGCLLFAASEAYALFRDTVLLHLAATVANVAWFDHWWAPGEWDESHGGGLYSWIPVRVDGEYVTRRGVPDILRESGARIDPPSADIGIDLGFHYTGIAAFELAVEQAPPAADFDLSRGDGLSPLRARMARAREWLQAHPGWTPSWVWTMKFRELPSHLEGMRV